MHLDEFKNLIPLLQKAPLGGIEAQFKLAPNYRQKYDLDYIKSTHPTLAAVLMLIFPDANQIMRFVLTIRPDYSGVHANQISFTGGKKSELDRDLLATAIRETEEEIGVKISEKNVLKNLTEVFIPPSNFLVQPYLTYVLETPVFVPNYEVKKLLTPSISQLIQPQIVQRNVTGSSGIFIETHGFIMENEFVWGATAMMLSEIKYLFNNIDK